MELTFFVTTLAAAAYFTHLWLVSETAVGGSTLFAGAWWSLAALKASNVTMYHHDGSSTVLAEPAFQYFCLGFAVISFGTWGLWYFGEYPLSDAVDDEMDPEGKPTNDGV